MPITLTINELLARHRGVLLDAYGVLVNHEGPLPGAEALIDLLNTTRQPYLILTNDASRLPETISARFRSLGLSIEPHRIISSGALLPRYFEEQGLVGERCIVLGPEDSLQYVRDAGAVLTAADDPQASVVVLCDEVGYPFLETVDALLTTLFRRIDLGQPLHLLLPNPDLIYPKGEGTYGVAAGCLARMFEAALEQRYPEQTLSFRCLGKPARPIFSEAARRARTTDLVMVGDQLRTDIAGALGFGIPAALVAGGLDRWDGSGAVTPSYLLQDLSLLF